jgi:putative membrane protein
MMYDYYGYNNYFSPMHSFFGSIFMILFWVLIIWGLISLIRHSSPHSNGHHSRAIDILKERYAKGEITKEQFEAMKKDIS